MLEKQKAELRNTIRQQLKALPEKEKEVLDREIAKRVLELAEIGNGIIFAYASLSWEAGTGKILEELWKEKRSVFLPRVSGETMEFFLTGSKKDLTEGAFHILEPKAGCRSADESAAEATKTGVRSSAWISSAPILIPVWLLRNMEAVSEKAADIMTGIWRRTAIIKPLPLHMNFRS